MAKNEKKGKRAPNGASSVYYGSDGYWHGRVTIGVKDDGTPDRRHVKRSTERDCVKAVRELEQEREAGKVRKVGPSMTVETWLVHWVEKIAAPHLRATTMVGYRTSVYKHLVPGVGAHRLAKLKPEHLEALYARMQAAGLAAGTVHLVHRTVRASLNEAVRRGELRANPVLVARPPRVDEEEVVPFSKEEGAALLKAAQGVRNGARYVIGLTLGLRRGEALGLLWTDLSVNWEHGCEDDAACLRWRRPEQCEHRRGAGTLRVRRALQQQTWKHGCTDEEPCGHRYGAHCPRRHGGGVVVSDVKSRAGRRTAGVPAPLVAALEAHPRRQDLERRQAGELWRDEGWMFTNHLGGPVHPTVDHVAWKALLKKASVRDARLHDARHTAATMLLVLGVPLRAVMDLMGWSSPSMATRYQHVPPELIADIAGQVGDFIWPSSSGETGSEG